MTSHTTDFLPTETHHFKARHNPWVGITLLIIGVINLLLIIWIMLLTGKFNTGIITGLVCAIAGFLYLTSPYFSIAPNRLTVYSLIGSTVKRYPFASLSSITISGSKIVIASADTQQPETAKIAKWLTHPKDWETVKSMAGQ